MKILRILQEREFERVGGTKTVPIDVRVIAATNKNLADQVKKGEFREDLYYRLNVMFIEIPPLRERMDDLEALVGRLLARISDRLGKHVVDLSSTAMDFLRGHSWPGNVAPRNYDPFPVLGQNGWPLAGIPRLGSYEAIE